MDFGQLAIVSTALAHTYVRDVKQTMMCILPPHLFEEKEPILIEKNLRWL